MKPNILELQAPLVAAKVFAPLVAFLVMSPEPYPLALLELVIGLNANAWMAELMLHLLGVPALINAHAF